MELYSTKEIRQTPVFQLGKVINNFHTDYKGMVQVSFYAYHTKANRSDWMRVMTPMSGKNKGLYFLPEIGDEVIIAFINNTTPCVIGTLWSQESDYPEGTVTKNNNIKTLVMESGIKVVFDETKGKEKVEVNTPKKLTFSLEDEKDLITIRSRDKKNYITIDGNTDTITIISDHKFMIKSEEISLEANHSLTLQSPSIEISSKQKLNLECTGKTTLKGSEVAINE